MLYRGEAGIIRIEGIFGTISPENFYQNGVTGVNNVQGARAAMTALWLEEAGDWPIDLIRVAQEFNKNSSHV